MPLESVGIVADRHAVIVDIGVAYTKCGFATEHAPRFIVPSRVLDAKSGRELALVDRCRDPSEQRELLVQFFMHLYFKKLLVNPRERRLVLCESVLTPTSFRNLVADVLFNHFEVPSIVFIPTHLASCFPLGTQNALVVDVGFTETLVLPIYEGIPMLNCYQVSPIGQKTCFEALSALLKKFGSVKTPNGESETLTQNSELLTESVLEDIKVRCCFVTNLERAKSLRQLEIVESSKETIQKKLGAAAPSVDYPLKGEYLVQVDGIVREATCENLFKRGTKQRSVSQLVLDSILKCPIDIRKQMLQRIHVIGGGCMTLGFMDRLKNDLLDLLQDEDEIYRHKLQNSGVKFFKPPVKPNCVAWLGASIFGGLEILPHRSMARSSFLEGQQLPDWTNFKFTQAASEDQGDSGKL